MLTDLQRFFILIICLIFFSHSTIAYDELDDDRYVFGFGWSSGGDTIGGSEQLISELLLSQLNDLNGTNGTPALLGLSINDSDDLSAGEGFSIFLGRIFQYNETLDFQVNLGYQTSELRFDNDGENQFENFYLDAMAYYIMNSSDYGNYHRFGFGLSYHFEPEVHQEITYEPTNEEGSKVYVKDSVKFDDAVGIVAAYEYRMDYMTFGIRYEFVEYEPSESSRLVSANLSRQSVFTEFPSTITDKIDGNSIKFYVQYHF